MAFITRQERKEFRLDALHELNEARVFSNRIKVDICIVIHLISATEIDGPLDQVESPIIFAET
jgi:hypothetical protein